MADLFLIYILKDLYLCDKMESMSKINLCCFISLLSVFLIGCKPSSPVGERYVVVLSMDGFRSDYPSRAHTPTLDSLANVGVRSTFRPCFPSVTFPNHYSMATGLHPDHHGLVNNWFYDAEVDSVYSMGNLDPQFYGGEPIWSTAEKQGVRSASFYWVGSEVPLASGQPSIWKPFDKSVPFSDRADSVVSWLRLPEKVRPHLIMWYIEQPDAIGHSCTPDSSATLAVVEELDKVLNHFFTEARKLDIFEKIDFIVLSDHGMATYYPDKYVNLHDYLPRDSFDYVFEGAPTLLYPKKSYTDSAYAILRKVPHITVYQKNEIPDRFVYGKNPRVSDLVVFPDIGTYVHFRPESHPVYAATHGYDNFTPEMEAIFYAAGPSFKEHVEVPAMANVNLYLMIARLLGVRPAPNDGDSAVVQQLFR